MARRHSDEPVTVLESGDPAVLAVAKSLLESADIPFFAKGEGLQNLFAGGTLAGFNPFVGPVELQVSPDDAADARAVLIKLIPPDE
jgi:hypothetical protein